MRLVSGQFGPLDTLLKVPSNKTTELSNVMISTEWHLVVSRTDKPLAWENKKTADILRRYHWFFREMTSEERAQKSHTDEVLLSRSG